MNQNLITVNTKSVADVTSIEDERRDGASVFSLSTMEAKALHEFKASTKEELSFAKGSIIKVFFSLSSRMLYFENLYEILLFFIFHFIFQVYFQYLKMFSNRHLLIPQPKLFARSLTKIPTRVGLRQSKMAGKDLCPPIISSWKNIRKKFYYIFCLFYVWSFCYIRICFWIFS